MLTLVAYRRMKKDIYKPCFWEQASCNYMRFATGVLEGVRMLQLRMGRR